jgi:hypothetical protein
VRLALVLFASHHGHQLTRQRVVRRDDPHAFDVAGNAAAQFVGRSSRRYERGSVLVTSNRAVAEWGEVFGELNTACCPSG